MSKREFDCLQEPSAPIFSIARHRLDSDGKGVTTLVGFHGCPLHCRCCINARGLRPNTPCRTVTPTSLYDEVKCDALYFLATGGGVTFGGGEPLLYPDFLLRFREKCGGDWRLRVETSLAVPPEAVRTVAVDAHFDEFIVDCKDADPEIYRRYTGGDASRMQENLRFLLSVLPPEKILLRLPCIPGYNEEKDLARSEAFFREMGATRFDRFVYTLQKNGKPLV